MKESHRNVQVGGSWRVVDHVAAKPATLELSRLIGKGTFGEVHKARDSSTDKQLAVKRVSEKIGFKCNEVEMYRFLNKSGFQHPNILKFYYFWHEECEGSSQLEYYMVFEYVHIEFGKLIEHYTSRQKKLPVSYILLHLYQATRALMYLHALEVFHRDIKPQNILIDPSSQRVVLCDFGSAKIMSKGKPRKTYITTRAYRAPELILDNMQYTTAVDIWSLGCVLGEAFHGKPLISGDGREGLLSSQVDLLGMPTVEEQRCLNPLMPIATPPKKLIETPPKLGQVVSDPIALDCIRQMLHWDPFQRLTAVQVLAHPLFAALRKLKIELPDKIPLPPLFNFCAAEECAAGPHLQRLLPSSSSEEASSGPCPMQT